MTIFCSIFPILDFPGKWSSRMNNLSRKVHTFVDQVSQNVFHHFTIGFLSNFPTYCSFLPLILSNSPTYFSTGSQQYFPMYFMMFSIDFTFFLKQNILIIVLKQLSKTAKTGFQLSIHVMANTGNPKTLIVETTIGTNGVKLLQPPDYTGKINSGRSWAPPRMMEKQVQITSGKF